MKPPNTELATRYLQAVAERRLKDGEKEFEQVRGTLDNSEWSRGYLKALEGLLLTLKSNDSRYLYLQRIKLEDKAVKRLKEEFKVHSANELHAEYDRGYFTALADYTSVLEQLKPWNIPNKTEKTEVATEERPE